MIDMHIKIHYTSSKIAHDWKLMIYISDIFGRKIFGLSLIAPKFYDMYVVEGHLLYDFHLFSFKLVSLFLRR